MTSRRDFLALAGVVGLLAQLPARAQLHGRKLRLGILRPSAAAQDVPAGLISGLQELGYAEGRNLVIERRYAAGRFDQLGPLARELVAARVDVLVGVGSSAAQAARNASSTVPIIMFGNFDPVALGLVTNLARPEANVTGILISADGTLAAKRIELLREAVPHAVRFAVLAPPERNFRLQLDETRKAANVHGITLDVEELQQGDYAGAFARIAARKPDALVVGAHTLFMMDRLAIIALAAQYRLPAVYEWPEQVRDGGLLAYGTDLDRLWTRVAVYADQLLIGRKPSDLPVEQPTTFRLALNLRTAKALGLVLPQSLLLRADEVVQ